MSKSVSGHISRSKKSSSVFTKKRPFIKKKSIRYNKFPHSIRKQKREIQLGLKQLADAKYFSSNPNTPSLSHIKILLDLANIELAKGNYAKATTYQTTALIVLASLNPVPPKNILNTGTLTENSMGLGAHPDTMIKWHYTITKPPRLNKSPYTRRERRLRTRRKNYLNRKNLSIRKSRASKTLKHLSSATRRRLAKRRVTRKR